MAAISTPSFAMNVFLTGAAGYIGGTIANKLLAAGHQVTGLVRSAERASQVSAHGIQPVLGDLSQLDLLRQCATASDAVISAAHADDRGSVEVMLDALAGTGKPFIHTSGSGVVADAAGGAASDRIYDDESPVAALPFRVPRAELNQRIVDARNRGVRSVVIAPPMIYGDGLGVHVDSIQIPTLIAKAKQSGFAAFIGEGANRWSNVHVEDLADLYVLALERAPAGFYCYAENGENALREIAIAIARAQSLGEPRSLTQEAAAQMFGEVAAIYSLGSNSRVRARLARVTLGWCPTRPSLLHEIDAGCYA